MRLRRFNLIVNGIFDEFHKRWVKLKYRQIIRQGKMSKATQVENAIVQWFLVRGGYGKKWTTTGIPVRKKIDGSGSVKLLKRCLDANP